MKKIKKIHFILFVFCILFFVGCNNDFYEKYEIMNKKELSINDLGIKTNDISNIISNITTINGENYVCNIYSEYEFDKSYVPITQRTFTSFIYDENKLKQSSINHSFSPDYNYFEENILDLYIEQKDKQTILYTETKKIFEEDVVEDKAKNIIDEESDLLEMFPLYYIFLQEQYEKNNSNITQLNDCNINGKPYYHLQFSTNDYNNIIVGEDIYILDTSIPTYDYYINQETFVIDYIVFVGIDEYNKNYYCLIEYKEKNETIIIPDYLLNMKNEY